MDGTRLSPAVGSNPLQPAKTGPEPATGAAATGGTSFAAFMAPPSVSATYLPPGPASGLDGQAAQNTAPENVVRAAAEQGYRAVQTAVSLSD